jgi:hypothetical protein
MDHEQKYRIVKDLPDKVICKRRIGWLDCIALLQWSNQMIIVPPILVSVVLRIGLFNARLSKGFLSSLFSQNGA